MAKELFTSSGNGEKKLLIEKPGLLTRTNKLEELLGGHRVEYDVTTELRNQQDKTILDLRNQVKELTDKLNEQVALFGQELNHAETKFQSLVARIHSLESEVYELKGKTAGTSSGWEDTARVLEEKVTSIEDRVIDLENRPAGSGGSSSESVTVADYAKVAYAIPTTRKISDTDNYKAVWFTD